MIRESVGSSDDIDSIGLSAPTKGNDDHGKLIPLDEYPEGISLNTIFGQLCNVSKCSVDVNFEKDLDDLRSEICIGVPSKKGRDPEPTRSAHKVFEYLPKPISWANRFRSVNGLIGFVQ
ncbi:hypothetical protein U1Q18_003167 [Sarracenia purpurea var. burkii]